MASDASSAAPFSLAEVLTGVDRTVGQWVLAKSSLREAGMSSADRSPSLASILFLFRQCGSCNQLSRERRILEFEIVNSAMVKDNNALLGLIRPSPRRDSVAFRDSHSFRPIVTTLYNRVRALICSQAKSMVDGLICNHDSPPPWLD